MPDYGRAQYRQQMTPPQSASADFMLPFMNAAIKRAEGNPQNYGVRSIPTSSPAQADTILNNSIFNNFFRWIQSQQPGKFVDFMQNRWAPMGAENDPNNLNQNWAPNVRGALFDMLGPEEYQRWQQYNMVKKPMDYFQGGGYA